MAAERETKRRALLVPSSCPPMKLVLIQTLGSAVLSKTDWSAQPGFLEQRTLGILPHPHSRGTQESKGWTWTWGLHTAGRTCGLAKPLAQESWTQESQESCSRGTRGHRREGCFPKWNWESCVCLPVCLVMSSVWFILTCGDKIYSFYCHGRGRDIEN